MLHRYMYAVIIKHQTVGIEFLFSSPQPGCAGRGYDTLCIMKFREYTDRDRGSLHCSLCWIYRTDTGLETGVAEILINQDNYHIVLLQRRSEEPMYDICGIISIHYCALRL